MLKTSLMILYGLPVTLVFFWSYNYFVLAALNGHYEVAIKELNGRSRDFSSEMLKLKPDTEILAGLEKDYYSYRKLQSAFKTTFNRLFEALERTTPGAVMFKRINARPDKLVHVVIDGEAEKLDDLTMFVRRLHAAGDFINPQLKKHTSTGEANRLAFSLEVDYLGQKGELP